MTYRIKKSYENEYTYSTKNIDEVIEYCISDDYHDCSDDDFDYWVNDNYRGTEIAGREYSAYDILNAFNNLCDVEDAYISSQTENDEENARYDLRHADYGDTVYIQSYEVYCDEDDLEEEEEYDEERIDDSIETLRAMVESDRVSKEAEKNADNENRNDYMNLFQNLFQTIGT